VIRIARSLGLTFAALVAVVALLAAFRIPLSEAGLKAWLAASGVETPAFRIDRLGVTGLTIVDVSAGTDGALTVARIAVDLSPATLLRGRVETVAIEGLRVRARIADGSFEIAGIALPGAGPGGEDGGKPFALPLKRLYIADSRLDLETPYGPLVITATARYGDANGGITGSVSVAAQGEPGHVRFTGNATGPDTGRLDGTVSLSDGAIETPVLRVPAFHGEGRFRVEDFRLDTASVSLAVPEVVLPTVPGGLTGRLDAKGDYENGKAGLRLSFEEAPGGRGVQGTIALSDLTGDADTLSGSVLIDGRMQRYEADGVALRDVTARLPLAIRRSGANVEVTVAEDARIAAAGFTGAGVTARDPVIVTLPATGAPLATLTLGDDGRLAALAHTVSATVAPTRLGTAAGNGAPTLDLGETRLTYTGRYDAPDRYIGHGNLANTNASVDTPPLAMQRIEADFAVDDIDGNGALRVDIGRLSDKAAPERFTAVGVALNVTRKQGKGRFVAAVRDATQTIRATASGPWPFDGPGDEIFLDIPPIEFATGGKQPATLLPVLSAFEVSKGRVFGNARIGRRGDGWNGSADITLDDMTFAVAGAAITGLAATLHLDSLVPPTTPPAQSLTIARIDMLTPIENIRVDYAVTDMRGSPRIDIAAARAAVLGGEIAITDAALPLDGRPVELPIAVSGIDVTRLLDVLGIEKLTGSGALSGRIPLRLSRSAAEISGGRLVADGPGVLQLDAKSAADFLAAQGPSVDLAIRALEDFRYSELTIDIEREAAGEAGLVLSLLGHNPAVLEGHPFRFNINLKSNVDDLIAALLQGYRIATDRVSQGAGKR
jgi:hypothetical protein